MLYVDLPPWPPRLQAMRFAVEPGRLIGVLGPNGAGKSSLLAAIAGEAKALRPFVRYRGRPVSDLSPVQLARLRALMPQQMPSTLPLSAAAVIELGLQRNMPEWRDHPAIEALELAALLDRGIDALSGGERQRVHLARVCLQLASAADGGPQLLLLDESLRMLDIRHQQRLLRFLRGWLRSDRLSVIWVSHDLNLVYRHADQALLLSADGRLLAHGPTPEVMTAAHLSELFDWPIRFHACRDGYGVFTGGNSDNGQRARAEKSGSAR